MKAVFVPFEQCAGKTIQSVFVSSPHAFTKFTDGTYTVVSGALDDDYDSVSRDIAFEPLSVLEMGNDAWFVYAGIMEVGEYQVESDQYKRACDEMVKERRRREYEQLKKEFEASEVAPRQGGPIGPPT